MDIEGKRVSFGGGLRFRWGEGEMPREPLAECWAEVGVVGDAGASARGLEICKGMIGSRSLSLEVDDRLVDARGRAGDIFDALFEVEGGGESPGTVNGFVKRGKTGEDMLACRREPMKGRSSSLVSPLPEMESLGLRVKVTLCARLVSSFDFCLSLDLSVAAASWDDPARSATVAVSGLRWREKPVTLSVSWNIRLNVLCEGAFWAVADGARDESTSNDLRGVAIVGF